jgi:copper homeostasis protein
LRDACGLQTAVFHRAFDVTPDPFAALESLIGMGFHRVMTSGQSESAAAGTELIGELRRRAGSRIEVLPAAGIKPNNVQEIVRRSECDQVHASVRSMAVDSSCSQRPGVRFGPRRPFPEGAYDQTDESLVRALREATVRH